MKNKDNDLIRAANKAYAKVILGKALPNLREKARATGYALAVHGTLMRDIDILAVAWTDEAENHEDFLIDFMKELRNNLGAATILSGPTKKPHERIAYTIIFNNSPLFIDLSIIPPKRSKNHGKRS